MAQNFIVALLVVGCFVYALWTLAPRSARNRLAKSLVKWPLPLRLQKRLQSDAQRQSGCGGCDGCASQSPAHSQCPTRAVVVVLGKNRVTNAD
jgi:hypothetical protein